MALALLQGLGWATLTAPLNGPDEAAHAAYAQQLAETGDGPMRDGGAGSYSTSLELLLTELDLRPIVGHVEGRPSFGRVSRVDEKERQLPPEAFSNGTGPNAVAQNPPVYYAYTALAYRLSPVKSILGRLYAMRLATILCMLGTVAFTWLAAGELFSRTWLRFVATGLVATQPKLAALSGVINPDSLLILVSSAFVYVALTIVRRGITRRRLIALGVATALGPLVHGRGFALVLAVVGILFICLVRWRPRGRLLMTTVAVPLVIAAIGALVAVLWTGAHSGTAFGGEIQSGASQSFSVRQFASYVFQFYFGPFSFLTPLGPPYGYRQVFIDTYFGGFASLEVNLRLAIYDYLQIAAAVGLLALMVTVVIRRGDVRRRWPECGVAIVTFVALMSLLHVSAYRDLQVGGDPLLTGRYLLPCVSLYGFTIAWVLGSFRRRIATILASCALGISLVLALQALLVNAARFYA